MIWRNLFFANSNDSTSQTSASIASCLRQLMSALAKIIWISMHDNGTSQNAQIAAERQLLVFKINLGLSILVSNDIAQIAGVSICVSWSAMFLVRWIEVWSGWINKCVLCWLPYWTLIQQIYLSLTWHATIGVISELMNMESMETSFQASNLAGNFHGCIVTLKR